MRAGKKSKQWRRKAQGDFLARCGSALVCHQASVQGKTRVFVILRAAVGKCRRLPGVAKQHHLADGFQTAVALFGIGKPRLFWQWGVRE
jgi:hypothetical protein